MSPVKVKKCNLDVKLDNYIIDRTPISTTRAKELRGIAETFLPSQFHRDFLDGCGITENVDLLDNIRGERDDIIQSKKQRK